MAKTKKPRKRTVRNTRELRAAFTAFQTAVDEAGMIIWNPVTERPRRDIPADEWFWSLAEAMHWLQLLLAYCEGYGYGLPHLVALSRIWAATHRITDADLDSIDRSVPLPDMETMAAMTSNIQALLGLGPQPGDHPTLDSLDE